MKPNEQVHVTLKSEFLKRIYFKEQRLLQRLLLASNMEILILHNYTRSNLNTHAHKHIHFFYDTFYVFVRNTLLLL